MMKRALDVTVAILGLMVLSPILGVAAIAIWLRDFHSPLYVAARAGRYDRPFLMFKLRSMVLWADRAGVDSTAGDDPRITSLGRLIRKTKLDEVPQLWNVLRGEMSLVGPRPQVLGEVALYTLTERELLSVRPGITDIASIVFSDEAEILRGSPDPDEEYRRIIQPWKSRLALLYVRNGLRVWVDLQLIFLTVLNAVARERTLALLGRLVIELGGDVELQKIAMRAEPLRAGALP